MALVHEHSLELLQKEVAQFEERLASSEIKRADLEVRNAQLAAHVTSLSASLQAAQQALAKHEARVTPPPGASIPLPVSSSARETAGERLDRPAGHAEAFAHDALDMIEVDGWDLVGTGL